MTYLAPIDDLRFTIADVIGLDRLRQLDGQAELDGDLLDAVLDQAGRLASEVLAPLNAVGDREMSRLENGVVRTPSGFREAYSAYRDGGWAGLPFEAEFGGQGLPWTVATAVNELWQSANMAFGLCPLLSQGAVEALLAHGAPALKETYLPRLISGEWTGTMNLTEPQAGSDLSTVRTKAVPDGDHYRLTGQKIYITYGDHDFAENIIHLVLARLPDAPEGTKGISLFLVPKRLVNADGSLGAANDVRCVGLEHKLGIHASPTCTLAFGEGEGAIGYLVGEEHRGLAQMFTMMNNARLTVGVQGVGIAERAYQQARAYAADRVQGRSLSGEGPVTILQHADVRRMLLTMRALTEAGRGLSLAALMAHDEATRHSDPDIRKAAQARVDLLTPVVKGWCTDIGVEVASIGVQVHGGMGYVEETGAAQHYRDSRIAPIYEGTNGIQANDLVFRKVLRDGGAAVETFLKEARAVTGPAAADLSVALDHLADATAWLLETGGGDAEAVAAAATPYMHLFGTVAGGVMMAKAEAVLNGDDTPFARRKQASCRFYRQALLPRAAGLAASIAGTADGLAGLTDAVV